MLDWETARVPDSVGITQSPGGEDDESRFDIRPECHSAELSGPGIKSCACSGARAAKTSNAVRAWGVMVDGDSYELGKSANTTASDGGVRPFWSRGWAPLMR